MPSDGPYRQAPRASAPPKPGEYACPACSLAVRDDARACPRCGAPIATVRCAECFHMNVAEAALCTGCGRELGLSPAGEPPLFDCPDCKLPLAIFRGSGGALHDCGRCGGQFVDHALLEALLVRREAYGRARRGKLVKANPLDSPVRYQRCPECRDVMLRKNFGGTSGIIVDICRQHGTWFDPGELPRVLAFVEAGGLAAVTASAPPPARVSMEMTEASSELLELVRALVAGR